MIFIYFDKLIHFLFKIYLKKRYIKRYLFIQVTIFYPDVNFEPELNRNISCEFFQPWLVISFIKISVLALKLRIVWPLHKHKYLFNRIYVLVVLINNSFRQKKTSKRMRQKWKASIVVPSTKKIWFIYNEI